MNDNDKIKNLYRNIDTAIYFAGGQQLLVYQPLLPWQALEFRLR